MASIWWICTLLLASALTTDVAGYSYRKKVYRNRREDKTNSILTKFSKDGDDGTCKIDLMFLVDSSTSVQGTNFMRQLMFVSSIVQRLDVHPDRVRVGVVRYNNKVYPDFHLDTYITPHDAVNAISRISHISGGTNTARAIRYIRDVGFSAINGGRDGVRHIAVLITDGRSANSKKTKSQARKAHKMGIEMFSIGIGEWVDRTELESIASGPTRHHMFQVPGFYELPTIRNYLLDNMCPKRPKDIPLSDGRRIPKSLYKSARSLTCSGRFPWKPQKNICVDAGEDYACHNPKLAEEYIPAPKRCRASTYQVLRLCSNMFFNGLHSKEEMYRTSISKKVEFQAYIKCTDTAREISLSSKTKRRKLRGNCSKCHYTLIRCCLNT